MKTRFIQALRWIGVLPGALGASILSTFPLHFSLYYALTQFVEPYPELPERFLTPGVVAGVFVWAGAKIAPTRKLETAIVLFGLWTVLVGIEIALVVFHVKIADLRFDANYGGLGPVVAFVGAAVGVFVVKHEEQDGRDLLREPSVPT